MTEENRQGRSEMWAVSVMMVTVLGAVMIIWFALTGRYAAAEVTQVDWLTALSTVVSFGVAGAVLIDRRSDLPFGWLLSAVAVSQAIRVGVFMPAAAAVVDGSQSALALWGLTTSSLGFLPIAAQGLVYVRFPSGTPASRWGRALERVLIVGTVAVVVGGALGATSFREALPAGTANLAHPLTAGTSIGAIADSLLVFAPLVVLFGLAAGLGVLVRFVRSEGIERQQLKWMATGIIVSLALFPFAVAEVIDVVDPLVSVVFVVTLAVPVMRYRLWSIDTIIRRSVAYGVVTGALVSAYFALAVLGASLFSERVGASVAAVVVALGFAPLLSRVQGYVDRVAFGDRSDPYRAISDLDRHLSEVVAPGQMLDVVVETIANSLRIPFVGIRRHDGSLLASHGRPGETEERWPLVYEGKPEGELVASPRRGEDRFDQRDRRLLADLARHTGATVHAEALTIDLLAARHRLVTAREEERRRMRRDLHDGLGPLLTAIGLNLDAARTRLLSAPETAGETLDGAKTATTQAINDVRRLVYDLRPPALDNLGLAGAVRQHTDLLHGERIDFEVDADGLPELPAAVEVAAYRAVVEAVTNSIRHGDASICTVALRVESGHLVAEVSDDGTSVGPWVPGVGLASIREQSAELGGSVTAGPLDDGGSRVLVRFPLGAEA